MRTAPEDGELDELGEEMKRIVAKVYAEVGQPLWILKRQIGCVQTNYHGLAKNRTHLFTPLSPGNLFIMRRRLTT